MASKVQDDSVSTRYTIPSILYSPEEARGFDCKYISEIGLKGLNKLRKEDVRFNHFIRGPNKVRKDHERFTMNDFFSHKDKEIDLESLGGEDISQINSSIYSYLRLLTGFLEVSGSIETLEYLIRIYRIHVYNWEQLLLSVLPSHEKPVFVRIVQLLPLRNSKWEFLVHVTHGVPLSRDLLIQKCKEDFQFLKALCDYVPYTETSKYPPSKTVVIFTTELVMGVLRSMTTVDIDSITLIKSFVNKTLQYGVKGAFCYDSALQVIGLLATRAKNLEIRWFMKAIMCCGGSMSDIDRVQTSIKTLVFFVKEQSVTNIPMDVLRRFKEKDESILCRKISGVLENLSQVLDISKFMEVLLLSFLRQSESHHECAEVLVSVIDTLPLKEELVDVLILETLSMCLVKTGEWARLILQVVRKKYAHVLERSVGKFLVDIKEGERKAKVDVLTHMLDFMIDEVAEFLNERAS